MATDRVEAPDTSGWRKDPSKYPFPVGSNYQGEDPTGYWVYGADNLYHPNQQIAQKYNEESGLAPPKPKKPGAWDALGPVAAAAGAYGVAQAVTKPGFVDGIWQGVKAPFSGWGGTKPPVVPTGATGAAGAAPFSAGGQAAAGGDLASSVPFGFGGPSAAAPGAATQGAAAAGGAPAVPSMIPELTNTLSPSAAAGNTFGVLGGVGPTLGLAGQAAMYGQQGYQAFNELKDPATRDKGGVRGALLATGPFLGWAAPALDLFGLGHSKNYTDGKTREKMLDQLGPLEAMKSNGEKFSVTAEQFRKDPSTYNYDQASPTMQEDIGAAQALAFLKTGKEPGSKGFNDLAGLFANAHKSGVPTAELYQKYGESYDSARAKIQASDLQQQVKDALFNGLDESFRVNAFAGKPSSVVASSAAPSPSAPPPAAAAQVQKTAGGPIRLSPGVWQDAKGTYTSKTGKRGE